jgi:hypothetical protein
MPNHSKVWCGMVHPDGEFNHAACGQARGCEHASIFENALQVSFEWN